MNESEKGDQEHIPLELENIVQNFEQLLLTLTPTLPSHAISLISRFMERPKEAHWKLAKIILRYVKGTKRYGILYTNFRKF